ncbi:MAG: transposase [Chloroflexi bacterium]|nr:transposase [Chloroflexota bacterium]
MYAHGLSTRDIGLAFTDATGSCVISKSLVSEVTERLWQEYQAFRQRRLDDLEVESLFCDGLYELLRRTGQSKEALLCLWASCAAGRTVLLEVVLGNRESMDAWLDCLRSLVARGVRPPVLMTSDGAPGLVAALEQVFPKALRQRCLAHKTSNVLAKVSPQDHAQVKADLQSASYASSPEVARLIAQQWSGTGRAPIRRRWPASWTPSRGASPTCAVRPPTARTFGRRTWLSARSRRSGGGPR